ncbi:MAG: hypothetical protein ACI4Q6_01005, partial [Huintestinicola sp.]
MKIMKINVSEVRRKASGAFKNCLAECCFLSLMDSGIKSFLFVLIMLVGINTDAKPFERSLGFFERFPVTFLAISAVILLASYLLGAPLFFGVRWFFWQASGDNGVMPISSVFACYSDRKSVFRCVLLRIKMDASRLFPVMVLAGTVVLDLILGGKLIRASGALGVKIAVIAGSSVIIIGVVLLLLADSVKHILVGFIMASNPDDSAKEILAVSRKTVNKSYSSMLMLYLSLFGWLASCLLVFPVLFVKPFLLMITAVYFRETLADDEKTS